MAPGALLVGRLRASLSHGGTLIVLRTAPNAGTAANGVDANRPFQSADCRARSRGPISNQPYNDQEAARGARKASGVASP